MQRCLVSMKLLLGRGVLKGSEEPEPRMFATDPKVVFQSQYDDLQISDGDGHCVALQKLVMKQTRGHPIPARDCLHVAVNSWLSFTV